MFDIQTLWLLVLADTYLSSYICIAGELEIMSHEECMVSEIGVDICKNIE